MKSSSRGVIDTSVGRRAAIRHRSPVLLNRFPSVLLCPDLDHVDQRSQMETVDRPELDGASLMVLFCV